MLLRASSDALGHQVDTATVVGGAGTDDALVAYAVAAHTGEGLDEASDAVRAAVGVDGWVEAAMTVAVFNGLVRTADASGIPLDEGVVSATADDRARLGLDAFSGSANTDLDVEAGAVPHPARFG